MAAPAREFSDIASDDAIQCLRLHVVRGVGALRFQSLVQHFGSVDAVMSASRRELEQVPNIGAKTSESIVERRDETFIQEELQRCRKLGVRILCQSDDGYPALLREIADAPVCLYVKGQIVPQDRTAVAVVGSRRCTHYGREQAYRFGMQIARTGMTVISGLARGVDVAAHRGAVDSGGRTIAVLGCGLAHLVRHENAELAGRICQQGAVVSELPVDRPPDAANFPPRNRIIAGASLGTLVIEAASRSGALITARLAAEYDREVFALPGRADNDFATGTNKLIQRQHAKLVASLQDILEELAHAGADIRANYEQRAAETLTAVEQHMTADEKTIFDSLGDLDNDLEHICKSTRLPPEKISAGLMMLQLKGVVEQLPGNRFARLGSPRAI